MVAIVPLMTRVIAGVTVPNSPLINASIALAREALPENGFNHVMRAWLNGQTIINKLPEYNRSNIDLEAFGVAALFHDMGWAFNTSYISTDKIFPVDGADAARDFIRKAGGPGWNDHRLQLVWDAIALHTDLEIARFKEPEVAIMCAGTYTELVGPEGGKQAFGDLITVDQGEWQTILDEFPRPGFKDYFTDVMVGLCRLKPEQTYLNFVGDYGEKYLANYTKVGHRIIDILDKALPPN